MSVHDFCFLCTDDQVEIRIYDMNDDVEDGNPNDKDFQKMVIREFIKAVYVYDDHLRIVVDFARKDNTIDVPIKGAEKTADGSADGFAQGLKRCTKRGCLTFILRQSLHFCVENNAVL